MWGSGEAALDENGWPVEPREKVDKNVRRRWGTVLHAEGSLHTDGATVSVPIAVVDFVCNRPKRHFRR